VLDEPDDYFIKCTNHTVGRSSWKVAFISVVVFSGFPSGFHFIFNHTQSSGAVESSRVRVGMEEEGREKSEVDSTYPASIFINFLAVGNELFLPVFTSSRQLQHQSWIQLNCVRMRRVIFFFLSQILFL
jgi:hypothetical protein